MKRLFLIVMAALLFAGHAFALSVINGHWAGKAEKISLFAVENGVLREIAVSVLSDGGNFAFAFNHDKAGYYVVGTGMPVSALVKHVFYMKPGDRLDVSINESTYTLTGKKNTPENKEMERWYNLVQPLAFKAYYFMSTMSTYVDFFPLLEEKLGAIKSFKTASKVNAAFAASFAQYREYDLTNIILTFLQTPRSSHPQGEDYPEFFNTITIAGLGATSEILDYPFGLSLIKKAELYESLRKTAQLTGNERSEKMRTLSSPETMMSEIADSRVRGEVLLSMAGTVRSYAGLVDFEQKYGAYLVTDQQRERMKELITAKAGQAGDQAADFTFVDASGKSVSLSDFKGKAVYVDVWATWCAPCRAELPHLKKIEAEYEGKNIVFMGVSIDKQSDQDKWKEFLVKEQMPGVQLFAGDRSDDIGKPYKITGIPRFILFAKDGSIISADAPRPSSSEIRALLNSAL